MSDPLLLLSRLVALVFVPVMLLFPLIFAALVPTRVTSDSDRTAARARLSVLVLATVAALAIWLGLIATAAFKNWSPLASLVNFTWVLFFPLWFLLAMPVVRAKNPVWAGALAGNQANGPTVRVASLKNRERESPVRGFMLWVPAVVVGLTVIATAARGLLLPFEDRDFAGQGDAEQTRWLVALAIVVFIGLVTMIAVPISLRRVNAEPEPLAPTGSEELLDLYRTQRRRRIRGMFWLLGVLLPGFIGGLIALAVWFPADGSLIGFIGAFGGSGLGIAGGVFGTVMAVERVRIAEARARLESSGPQAAASPCP